jgi:hypothetical protein
MPRLFGHTFSLCFLPRLLPRLLYTFSMLHFWTIVQKPALKLSTENVHQSVHFLFSVRSLSLLSGLHSLPFIDMSTTKPSSSEPALK